MFRFAYLRWPLLACVVACVGWRAALAAEEQPAGPERIVQQQPSFFVKAEVDHTNREYREGDRLKINVLCEQDAYIYILYKQSDGKIFQIFPNSGQTENKIKAKTKVTFPNDEGTFTWKVEAPFGKEFVKAIASKEPLKNLEDPDLRAKLFNSVSTQKVKDLGEVLLQAEPESWAEDLVELTTHDKTWQPPPPPSKRFGVFIGVGNYTFDDAYHTATKDTLNRSSSALDAVFLNEVLKKVGNLDEGRVLVNEKATRDAIEEAITQWLPAVSKPGDTVFIHFTGHGDMIKDERTKRNRLGYILPADYVNTMMVDEIANRHKVGTITEEETAVLKKCLAWFKGAKPDQFYEILARKSGIPDDTFGHWMQRLAGRQIVVLLGSCHSGGFAEEGKSITPKNNVSFQYLDQQLERLNALGQGEISLMSACGSKETSLSYRVPDEQLKSFRPQLKGEVDDLVGKDAAVSVYGYYILESLLVDDAPLKLETTFDRCRRGTVDYIAKLNAGRKAKGQEPIDSYEPQLFKHGKKQVLLKPGAGG